MALAALAPPFWWLRRRWSAVPVTPRSFAATVTDLAYWVLSPALVRPLVRGLIIAIVGLWAVVFAQTLEPDALVRAFSSRSPIADQPLWLQTLEMVLLGDFLAYWYHRAFHRGGWWRFHAIHHSSRRLHWLASARLHPVNELIGGVLRLFPIFVLGFRLDLIAGYLPALSIYGLLLHANVRWDFGRLRYVIASPAFHRWHHSAEPDTCDVNFAGLLPVWDLVFGTFHLPRGQFPVRTGAPMPEGYFAQLVHPFRRERPTAGHTADAH